MARVFALALAISFCLSASAEAQLFGRRAPAPGPAEPVQSWPYPPPDAEDWWEGEWPVRPEALDPLSDRRLGRREQMTPVDNGIDPTLYRLWGLPPLQWQILRGDEMILEVWVRPSGSVRQLVSRTIVRRDGRAFVQARAGLACCEPGIGRRVDVNAELPAGAAAQLLALRNDPVWSAPRDVRLVEDEESADALCVEGVSYDVTLMVPGRSVSVRRACDPAEIGQAANVIEPVLRAAMAQDPRIDLLVPAGGDFARERREYAALLARGGALVPARNTRAQAPATAPVPDFAPDAADAAGPDGADAADAP